MVRARETRRKVAVGSRADSNVPPLLRAVGSFAQQSGVEKLSTMRTQWTRRINLPLGLSGGNIADAPRATLSAPRFFSLLPLLPRTRRRGDGDLGFSMVRLHVAAGCCNRCLMGANYRTKIGDRVAGRGYTHSRRENRAPLLPPPPLLHLFLDYAAPLGTTIGIEFVSNVLGRPVTSYLPARSPSANYIPPSLPPFSSSLTDLRKGGNGSNGGITWRAIQNAPSSAPC